MKTKPDNWYRQSAVIPYRIRNNNLNILLISSRKKKHWIIPKGIIEGSLTAVESAIKEATEEVGIKGKVSAELIGKYKYKKWGGICSVEVYAMEVEEVLNDWLESFRERIWVEYNIVDKYIADKKLLKIITKLKQKF